MDETIPAGRMIPGRYYRVTYARGPQETTVEGRFMGREVTKDGDELVVRSETAIHIPLSAVKRVEPVEPLPDKWIK